MGEVRNATRPSRRPAAARRPRGRAPARRPPGPRPPRPPRAPPGLAGEVPTAEEVIGFPLGEQDVTVAESDAYLEAVAAASPRVTAGTAAAPWPARAAERAAP